MATKKNKKIASKSSVDGDSFYKRNFYPILVFCFSFLLYFNTVSNDYNMDDELVTNGHKVTSQGIKAIPAIFTAPYYSDDMGYSYDYRPLVHVSFAIEHSLFGDNPHASHFINCALYGILCVLIYLVLIAMFTGGGYPLLPLIVTLIFAAHPIHTEVVASIKSRDELLAAVFVLLSFYFLFNFHAKNFGLSIFIAVLCFFCALLCKVTVLSFAVLIPCLYYLFNRKKLLWLMFSSLVMMTGTLLIYHKDDFKLNIAILGFSVLSVFVFGLTVNARNFLSKLHDAKKSFSQNILPSIKLFFHKQIVQQVGVALCFLIAIALGLTFFLYTVKVVLAVFILCTICIVALVYIKDSLLRTILYAVLFFSFFLLGISASSLAHKFIMLITLIFLLQIAYQSAGELRAGIAIWLLYLTAVTLGAIYDENHPLKFSFITRIISVLIFGLLTLAKKNYILKTFKRKEVFLLWLFWAFVYVAETRQQNWYFIVIAFLILAIIVGALFFENFEKKYLRSPYFLLVPLIFYGIIIFSGNNSNLYDSKTKYAKQNHIELSDALSNSSARTGSQIKFPAIGPTFVDRPLNFVEVPVPLQNPMIYSTAVDVMGRYLKLVVIPYPLSFYYGYKQIEAVGFENPMVILSLVLYGLLLLLLVFAIFREHKIIVAGLLIYLVGIAPFSNLVGSVPGMLAERYLFLPSLGFCICLGLAVVKFFQVSSAKITEVPYRAKVVLLIVFSSYSILTFSRNRDWKDKLTLMRHDLAYNDNSAQGHNLLALSLMGYFVKETDPNEKAKLTQEAIIHFKKAVEIYPPFFNPTYDLGRVYALLNMPDSAIYYYQKASVLDSTFADLQIRLGELLIAKGNIAEAVPYFEMAVKEQPDLYSGYDKLSYAYFALKQFDKSIAVNRKAMTVFPNSPDPVTNIGRTYLLGTKQNDSSAVYFKRSLLINPNNPEVIGLLQQATAQQQ